MKVLTKQNRKGNKSLHQKVKFWDLDLFSHFFDIVGAAADLNYSARLFFFSLLCFIFFSSRVNQSLDYNKRRDGWIKKIAEDPIPKFRASFL